MKCDECGNELNGNGEGHRIGCNFDRTPRPNLTSIEADRRTRIAKYHVQAERINPMTGSKRPWEFDIEFSKTGVSQRGESVEDFARREASERTGGYANVLSVSKLEVA